MEPKNIQLKQSIKFRMGGFDASSKFIGVIGNRFGGAGLRELCIEATFIGTSLVESMIEESSILEKLQHLRWYMTHCSDRRLKVFRDG